MATVFMIVVFAMVGFHEQCPAVRFCFLLGKNETKTLAMLRTAYKDNGTGEKLKCLSFSLLKNGEISIDDKTHSGTPTTARARKHFEEIREIIKENRQRTIEENS
ncbi:HTH_48 domain-containing protein [Trichonephila clavata]|uniref:HTH_48 domain-containing protein n=1 Tax=Trichonephila clavata TaxID=2740835 RepID=A0A8X6GUB4_TRICU|nr:HTH_48 domain-containing protein [Trichonephila clavata]